MGRLPSVVLVKLTITW